MGSARQLVALRPWRSSEHVTPTVEIRSDNLPTLLPITKGTSSDPSLTVNYPLIKPCFTIPLIRPPSRPTTQVSVTSCQTHCHALAPSPHQLPMGLSWLPRGIPPPRKHHFYRSSLLTRRFWARARPDSRAKGGDRVHCGCRPLVRITVPGRLRRPDDFECRRLCLEGAPLCDHEPHAVSGGRGRRPRVGER